MAEGITVLDEDEVEDFHASIEDLGYDKADFELTEKPDPTPGGSVEVVTGSVTVRRKSTRAKRTYAVGDGPSWPATFHNDLEQGVFGNP
jgi:hypothetical protein